MKTSIPNAMSRLRSANPVGAGEYRDAHASAYAQGLLERVASDPGHQPFRRSRTVGNRVLGTVVAAVAVLIAVAIGSVLVVRSLNASGAKPAPPAVTAPPAVKPVIYYVTKSNDPHFAATIAVLDKVLASAAMLPGAKPLAKPPLGLLNGGLVTPSYTNLSTPKTYDISGATWWTAPATVDAAITYFNGLNLKALNVTHGALASGYRAGSTTAATELLNYLPSGLANNDVDLSYEIEKSATGVAIRVDAATQWLPSHPAASYLPATASPVQVAVYSGGSAVHRSLSRAAAAGIAATLNGLTPGQGSCYTAGLDGKDAISFVTGGKTTSLLIDPGCDRVVISRPGAARIVLLGGHLLDSVIRQTLDLP